MPITEIQTYKTLTDNFSREQAKTLVEYVETKVDSHLNERRNQFATKEDLAALRTELNKRYYQLIVLVIICSIATIATIAWLLMKH